MEYLWPVLAENYMDYYALSFEDKQRYLQHNESVYNCIMSKTPDSASVTPLSKLLMEHLQCDQTIAQVQASDPEKAKPFLLHKKKLEDQIDLRKQYKEIIIPSPSLRSLYVDYTPTEWLEWCIERCCTEQQKYDFLSVHHQGTLEDLLSFVPRLGEGNSLEKIFFIMEVIQRSMA